VADKVTRTKIWTEFKKMRIKYPRLPLAHGMFDDLRAAKREAPLEPQGFASIFAPTHSGKSMTIRTYLETTVAEEAIKRGLFPADMDRKEIAAMQRIVLHITLDGVAKIKNLAEAILRALGMGNVKGTTGALLQLAYDTLKDLGTELLVIDEVQHLKTTKERAKFAELQEGETALTNTLKTMLIRGLVPIVFVGIETARPLIFNDYQLAGRCIVEIPFDSFDFAVQAEREIFVDYCGRIGLKLHQHGLFEQPSNFLIDDIPACLHAASTGRIGIVSRIVEQAAVIASDRGESCVSREHLKKAVDVWAIPKKFIDYNPFSTGVREVELVKK
jgi:hypothetical protein